VLTNYQGNITLAFYCTILNIAYLYANNSSHFWVWAFNATSNIISIILWRSVLMVEEIGVLGENHRPAASH
jgi:hypothetical protein